MNNPFNDPNHLIKMRKIWNSQEYKNRISNSQPNKLNLDENLLRKLYCQQKKSAKQIATELNISKFSVLKYLKKHKIPIRSKSIATFKVGVADSAWLAGFIDGEGWFGLAHASGGKCANKKWSLRIVVANCNKDSMQKIKNLLGSGCIMKRELSSKSDNWSDCYAIQISGKAIVRLLDLIEPYCIVKTKQIKLFREYLKHQQERKHGALTEDEINFRKSIKLQLSNLTRIYRKSKKSSQEC